ncbi:hypothetical protein AWB68_08394 [Caballeronia choica]|uniref:Uncharacterized protein n=1 Tax=Caballeronia choica TaxID=326476 RepID=A0A158L206_9BURK|nr:hypothetical protein [Caballeronia choica]SAL87416.1 hypothetical protein AWB68_08394 [Caballeronia choica]
MIPVASIPALVNALLGVLDRVVALKNARHERIETVFNDAFDPLFKDLENVHGDYLGIFEQVHEIVRGISHLSQDDGRKTLLEAIELLRHRRLEFEPVRVRLTESARQMGSIEQWGGTYRECPEAGAFVEAVMDYFPRARIGDDKSQATALLAYLNGVKQANPDHGERQAPEMTTIILRTLEDAREKWQRVCAAHARLKAKVVKAREP